MPRKALNRLKYLKYTFLKVHHRAAQREILKYGNTAALCLFEALLKLNPRHFVIAHNFDMYFNGKRFSGLPLGKMLSSILSGDCFMKHERSLLRLIRQHWRDISYHIPTSAHHALAFKMYELCHF